VTGGVILVLFVVLYFFDPAVFIERVGVTNSYLILFFIALIGGTSSFTATSYYVTIVTFALGGLNPWVMALVAGTALFIGDSLFYLFGTWGRHKISGKVEKTVERFSDWLNKKPDWIVRLVIYLYTGISPFPGDVLMLTLAFSEYPYKKYIAPGLLGNMTLVLLISHLAILGFSVI
jgi:membrane protein DedA with SNARE-associated domain